MEITEIICLKTENGKKSCPNCSCSGCECISMRYAGQISSSRGSNPYGIYSILKGLYECEICGKREMKRVDI